MRANESRPAVGGDHAFRKCADRVQRASGEQLVEDEPERIHVGALGDAAAGELLGRHVGRRAGDLAHLFGGRRRQAEVDDADLAAAVDHDVGRLEVAMQHAALVRGGDPGAQLPRHVERLFRRQAADPPQQRGQRLSVDVLHRQVVPALGFADVMDTADVRMGDVAGEPHFGDEALQHVALQDAVHREQLERDALPERQVVGAIDLTHPALTEQADDAVPAGEDAAWRKACLFNRRGARGLSDRLGVDHPGECTPS